MKRLLTLLVLTLPSLAMADIGKYGTVTVADSGTDSTEIAMMQYSFITLFLPNTLEGTTLQWKCAGQPGGTGVTIDDSADAACANTLTATTAAVVAPPSGDCAVAVAGCPYLTIVFGAQTGASTIEYYLK